MRKALCLMAPKAESWGSLESCRSRRTLRRTVTVVTSHSMDLLDYVFRLLILTDKAWDTASFLIPSTD